MHPGEVPGVVGESGCCKGVADMSIMRLLRDPPRRIAQGANAFQGEDLLRLNEDGMRAIRGNTIAMILKDPTISFNPALTIGRQIREVLGVHEPTVACWAAVQVAR